MRSNGILNSNAEAKARKALVYPAFMSIGLDNIKTKVTAILNHIGRNGVFSQYTKHDISHIDVMLRSIDWIIPQSVQEKLSSADWLMLVLAIYFHDLGMLVTQDEFDNRSNTMYSTYKAKALGGDFGIDYLKKVEALKDRGELFLYQEFVRERHAERIKYWILGKKFESLGVSEVVVDEISVMLNELDPAFKRDLALVCESHHLDDLNDITKYKLKASYGNSKNEECNLQYISVILRTADLLHITSDRTPSIEFRLINPSDPVSQTEWYKQMAIKSVRPQDKVDKEGNVDKSLQSDIIEVVAYFDTPEKADSFFALSKYLSYAAKQLKKSNEWIASSDKKFSTGLIFPWRGIDDRFIETAGFERKLFEFVLDQGKILNLLVGHTLYNDSTVVLRELIQNSIDAIRFWSHINNLSSIDGKITIEWNTENRILIVKDEGVGMNQEIIENYLLKVGSSRYQDDEFKRKYPNFSPISRFGIGILTCFLISDEIDITSITEADDVAKRVSIRNLDGKYLVQEIDKHQACLGNHGSEVKLKVRHSIHLDDIEKSLNRWIMFPPCDILLLNNGIPKRIGFKNPADIIKKTLIEKFPSAENEYDVRTIKRNGVELAIGFKYNPYYKEWEPVSAWHDAEDYGPTGTCIEGIRVEFNSPGYEGLGLLACANLAADVSPKTNIARSQFEQNLEYKSYLEVVYEIYALEIKQQIADLHQKENYSITWATNEAQYITNAFFSVRAISRGEAGPVDRDLFIKKLYTIPCVLIEEANRRYAYDVNECLAFENFWIIDSDLIRRAESFLQVFPHDSSVTKLLGSAGFNNYSELNKIFCGYRRGFVLHAHALTGKTVSEIKIDPHTREVLLNWERLPSPKWRVCTLTNYDRHYDFLVYIQLDDVVINTSQYKLMKAAGQYFVFTGSLLHSKCEDILNDVKLNKDDTIVLLSIIMTIVPIYVDFVEGNEFSLKSIKYDIDHKLGNRSYEPSYERHLDPGDFYKIVTELYGKVYDNQQGKREGLGEDQFDL